MKASIAVAFVVCSVGLTPKLAIADSPAARAVLSLDGVWDFATDPDNRGETEKWFLPGAKLPVMPLPGYAPTADGTIRVPGIWDNQGYGTETDKVRHNFVGKGWYRRTVEIPGSWKGRRTVLVVTGVSRYSKVWVNERFLGEHIGYLSTREYDLSPFVTPGQNATLTIQVDSKQRVEIDSMFSCSSLADFMYVPWGGIWGHVLLESRSDAWLSDLYVRPDVPGSSCTVSATLNGKAGLCDGVRLEVFEKSGKRVADAAVKLNPAPAAGQPVSVTVAVPKARLWTPDEPTLYSARLSLLAGPQLFDSVESRFGMRQFTTDGYRLLLNGKRIMLRGYGDDHIYPVEMAMPCDKEQHLKRLKLIKAYGFNHVRHHSTIMPAEYYDACDELGLITTAEFAICYRENLPKTDAAVETHKREWAASIKLHRNHPSILCWVMGNEIYDDIPLGLDFQRIARELDPLRFFSESDGLFAFDTGHWKNILAPENDRDTQDIFFAQFREHIKEPFNNTSKYDSLKPRKPTVAHEMGNYITFSRPDLADQFRHNFKPFWLTAGVAKLKRLGLLAEAEQWALKSERLYALLHKYNLEMLRKNPGLSGYHWWLFQDYWTSANGLVDHYFRPKSVTCEEVLKYNNDVVLLQEGLERTYRGNDRLRLKFSGSNFASEPLQGDFGWEVKAGKKTVAKQRVPVSRIAQGGVSALTAIDIVLPERDTPSQLKIKVSLSTGKQRFDNDWSAWLYPATIAPSASPVPVFADETQIKLCPDWGVTPIPAAETLDARAVYLVGFLEPRVVSAMERGAAVILIRGADAFLKSYSVTYKSSWWKAGDRPEENNTGTFVYDHPVTRAIAPDGWCDEGWSYLLENGRKFVLEDAPARPEVIVRALPGMAMVQDEALLFAVGVGKGSLIVSGLNHAQTAGRPESAWLLSRLLEYAAALPHPKPVWPASFLSPVYAAPDGCLTGYRCLAPETEGGSSPEVASWYSYRADSAPVYICRQNKKGNAVVWETVPYIPKAQPVSRVTFVFAGALGHSSEPKTEGFAFDINGKEALRFDMPAPERWTSENGRVELRFEPRRTRSTDQFGLFYLTVACDLLSPGKPCRLGVRSLGSDSGRWFGLNPYTDLRK